MVEKVKGKKKVLKITLISLAAFIFIFSVISMIIVKYVYDRQFQRNDKPEFSGYLRYSDLVGYDRTVVQFESGKNTLTGYIYGEKNNKGLVAIAHGLGGGAESYMAETIYFVDSGWRVFSFDCTGSYASEGKSTVGLPQSVLDLDAALIYIESNNTLNGLPVMLYGHSWGGYAVTSILNYNHDITAVASISGFNSPIELLIEQAESMMGGFAYIEYPYEWAYQTMLFGKTARLTAVDGINRTDIAVMIIHGDADDTISYGGASIMAHKSEIINPNVIYETRSAKNHNGHNDLFISDAASEYINQINEEYKALYDSYNGNIPDDVKAEFYAGIDKFQTSELDADFMNNINSFFEKELR